jgi:dienelactone hydrolase
VLAGALGSGAPASSSGPFGDCSSYEGVQVCTAQVPSFDGTELDVDLTKPLTGGGRHPLIVMLHGFANDKHEWESTTDAADGADKWHWNSHWFARHGYYVLSYTARGFRTDAPDKPYQPSTPAGSSASLPNGTIHLKSREFEARDTQWLAALAAQAFPDLDPARVAVTGGSYGGGESWLQATQPTWDFPNQASGGTLPVLQLQVAVPKYGWTDLSYSLAPNGHSGTGGIYDSAQRDSPIGTLKLSYVNGFYALGTSDGIFEAGTTTTPSEEGTISIPAWKSRSADTGDPYDTGGEEDQLVEQQRRGLTEFRGSYYQDWPTTGRKVAIFAVQGWTDDLFSAVESFRQFRALKALDPHWPVELALADVGHMRAQGKPGTWRWLNERANAFLRAQIGGSRERATGVSSEPTNCGGPALAPRVRAATPEGLARGALTVAFDQGDTLTWLGGSGDPDGVATDPVTGGAVCRESMAATWPGRYTAVSEPLARRATYIGLGSVQVPYTLLGGTTATLDARLWDVDASGRALFVDRGTYRIDVPAYDSASGTLQLPLFGNHWPFASGHRVRLDLSQVDEPFARRSNVPSTIEFAAPTLTLPTVEQTQSAP